jgi:hypothetical protein
VVASAGTAGTVVAILVGGIAYLGIRAAWWEWYKGTIAPRPPTRPELLLMWSDVVVIPAVVLSVWLGAATVGGVLFLVWEFLRVRVVARVRAVADRRFAEGSEAPPA